MGEDDLEGDECSLEGTTLTLPVTRVEQYGLYFETAQRPVLVLVPDVSREPIHLPQRYRVGDLCSVTILRYVPQNRTFKGTLLIPPVTEPLRRVKRSSDD